MYTYTFLKGRMGKHPQPNESSFLNCESMIHQNLPITKPGQDWSPCCGRIIKVSTPRARASELLWWLHVYNHRG